MLLNAINTPVSGSYDPISYINGLRVDWVSNTSLLLNPGSCSDSLKTLDMVVPNAITINANIKGIGGLDVGVLAANKFYYSYVVWDSRKFNPLGATMSLSSTSPYLPGGYDRYRKIAINRTDGYSNLLRSYTIGKYGDREFFYDESQTLGILAPTPYYRPLVITSYVPALDTTKVCFTYSYTPDEDGNYASIRPTGGVGDGSIFGGGTGNITAKGEIIGIASIVNGNTSIDFCVTNSNDSLVLSVKSFTYSL